MIIATSFLMACTGSMVGGTGGGDGGSGGSSSDGGGTGGSGGGSGGSGGAGGGSSTNDLPCAVVTVLQGTCQQCHGPTLANGAPMQLITRADLAAASTITSEMTIGQRSVLRMKAPTGRMPPAPLNPIASDLIDQFNTWVVAGMPAQSCGAGGGAGGGSGGGAGTGGGGGSAFIADGPAVYVAKVKNILVGLPPTDAEIATVTAQPSQLGTLVDGWMLLPQYQTKMRRFFQLSFQQTQVATTDFADMLNNGQLAVASNPMLQNLQESFARTVLAQNTAGKPFNTTMTTQTYMMTTALQVFYALTDVWQIDNLPNGVHDAFKTANPGKNIVVSASGGPIPLAQSIDPTSANYMHWYDPNIVAECGIDPLVIPARANAVYQILVGAKLNQNNVTCTKNFTAQLLPTDYTDWKMVTVRPPLASAKTTWFYDLPTLRNPAITALLLKRPYVGFFTTPAFFANWQTNASNEMRVTLNQTLIVATGAQVDGTDTTTPTATPGLDTVHANQAACKYCHQTLDPSRSIFSATFSWNYGGQFDPTWSAQKGLFAFRGVQATTNTIYDLGTILSTHPLLAPAWVQKLCYYVNSQACIETDPEFQRLATLFQTSNYSWNGIVKALVTSPLTTHAASTVTATTDGVAISVARRDHLCSMWNARFGFTDICGLDVTQISPLPNTAKQIVPGLPSDGYSRGATAPVLPNDPSLFYRAGIENLCGGLAALLIDNATPPPGAKTWSSTQPTLAITDFVNLVAGLPPADPRASQLNTLLTSHFNTSKAMTGITAKAALQSTFMAACMAPTASAVGL